MSFSIHKEVLTKSLPKRLYTKAYSFYHIFLPDFLNINDSTLTRSFRKRSLPPFEMQPDVMRQLSLMK